MNRNETPFTIRVDAPCQEDWQKMSQQEPGRFCQRCQHTVIDFSSFSDKELHQYFMEAATIPCGRFHHTQLNRVIGLPPDRLIKPRHTAPVAAAVLILFSLQLQAANEYSTVAQPLSGLTDRYCDKSNGDSLQISGTVRDHDKKPLAQAEISFNGELIGKTDYEGRFSFTISGDQKGQHTRYQLIAGYPGYINAVRNYHPAMGSTSFDITLYEPAGERSFYTMGIPNIANRITPVLLTFKKNENKLSPDSRTALAELALQMRNNPETVILLIRSGKTTDAVSAEKFSREIIRILTDEEGISADRFKTEKTDDPAHKAFTLHIRQENPQ